MIKLFRNMLLLSNREKKIFRLSSFCTPCTKLCGNYLTGLLVFCVFPHRAYTASCKGAYATQDR
jgi:hypothetical protein